jgi:hypothetical protein
MVAVRPEPSGQKRACDPDVLERDASVVADLAALLLGCREKVSTQDWEVCWVVG